MSEAMISIRDVTIRFGNLVALDNVSVEVNKGEIMALLGENGAGKSTLMKILYGLYSRESGEIMIGGKKMARRFSPSDAIKLGVSMVPQHFMLIDSFTIAENIVLGEEDKISKVFINKKRTYKKVDSAIKEFGINISPRQKVKDLSLGVKQKIEILKALYRGTELLILDEPTTVLTPQEVDELFVLLRSLRDKGITIILITHKLHEVLAVTDRVTVLRLGKKIATFETAKTNAKELAQAMVGKEIKSVHVGRSATEKKLQASFHLLNLNTKRDRDRCNLKDFNLDLYPGRIVGIAGIDGNGQTELVEVLTGVKQLSSGYIEIDGKRISTNTIEKMRDLGIGVIPEDRTEQGLILDLPIRDNIIVGYKKDKRFEKFGILNMKMINQYVDKLIEKYNVRPANRSATCRIVSGGNQQKVVLARELERPALQAVVASQPTRGLDIGATEFTHETLLKLRAEGKSVLLISSDLDEIKSLSDFISVIFQGSIVVSKKADEFTKDEIGLYMCGPSINQVTT
jgi:ABC-type uncharacterized transport system ATPase subunit